MSSSERLDPLCSPIGVICENAVIYTRIDINFPDTFGKFVLNVTSSDFQLFFAITIITYSEAQKALWQIQCKQIDVAAWTQ